MGEPELIRGAARVPDDAAQAASRLHRTHPDRLRTALDQLPAVIVTEFLTQRRLAANRLETELLFVRHQCLIAEQALIVRGHHD